MRVSPEVEIAFALAQREAARRRHEYVTVEHLLYALLFDEETAQILRHAGADTQSLKKKLEKFLDEEIPALPDETSPSLSLGFQRVVGRAAMHVQSSGKKELKGAMQEWMILQHDFAPLPVKPTMGPAAGKGKKAAGVAQPPQND